MKLKGEKAAVYGAVNQYTVVQQPGKAHAFVKPPGSGIILSDMRIDGFVSLPGKVIQSRLKQKSCIASPTVIRMGFHPGDQNTVLIRLRSQSTAVVAAVLPDIISLLREREKVLPQVVAEPILSQQLLPLRRFLPVTAGAICPVGLSVNLHQLLPVNLPKRSAFHQQGSGHLQSKCIQNRIYSRLFTVSTAFSTGNRPISGSKYEKNVNEPTVILIFLPHLIFLTVYSL